MGTKKAGVSWLVARALRDLTKAKRFSGLAPASGLGVRTTRLEASSLEFGQIERGVQDRRLGCVLRSLLGRAGTHEAGSLVHEEFRRERGNGERNC